MVTVASSGTGRLRHKLDAESTVTVWSREVVSIGRDRRRTDRSKGAWGERQGGRGGVGLMCYARERSEVGGRIEKLSCLRP